LLWADFGSVVFGQHDGKYIYKKTDHHFIFSENNETLLQAIGCEQHYFHVTENDVVYIDEI
jgi:hypothetical protein